MEANPRMEGGQMRLERKEFILKMARLFLPEDSHRPQTSPKREAAMGGAEKGKGAFPSSLSLRRGWMQGAVLRRLIRGRRAVIRAERGALSLLGALRTAQLKCKGQVSWDQRNQKKTLAKVKEPIWEL